MTRDKAKATIVAEGLALHPDLRSSEKQLGQFGLAATARHSFPSAGNPLQTVKAWRKQAVSERQLVS